MFIFRFLTVWVVIVGFLSLALFHSYLASFSRKLWDVCEQSGLFPRAKLLEHLLLAKRLDRVSRISRELCLRDAWAKAAMRGGTIAIFFPQLPDRFLCVWTISEQRCFWYNNREFLSNLLFVAFWLIYILQHYTLHETRLKIIFEVKISMFFSRNKRW